jgi:hypothetical protein
MYWALALLSLSLAAAPATTPAKPVATKTKAPVKAAAPASNKASTSKVPASKVPANKAGANKAAANTTAARPVAKVPLKPLPARGSAPAMAHSNTPPAAATGRGRMQPQAPYSRYQNTARTRRQVATSRTPARRPVYHPVQAQPTQDRYKEIQTSLVQKGYLGGEPSGTWDADSVAAMKRFQKDQNLDADGKLSALSLIALGLGPKRTLTASSGPPATTTIPVTPKP